jgi:predicted transcriptional regulator of viral defense system
MTVKLKHFFETHPIFRYEEFVDFMASQGITRLASCKQQLQYHQKAGHLIHLRKFIYAVKPSVNETIWIDPYLLASKAASNAVLAYHSALELHGLAYTTFNEFTFLTDRQIRPFIYVGQRFRAIYQPKTLLLHKKAYHEVESITREGLLIQITSLERTIVDLLDRPDLGGGWEEIWRSLENVTSLNVEKIISYALLLQNATTIAKVGFFLEQRPNYLTVDKDHTEKLLSYLPKQPHYMDKHVRGEGKYIEKWHLIVPLYILNRSWEETNALESPLAPFILAN